MWSYIDKADIPRGSGLTATDKQMTKVQHDVKILYVAVNLSLVILMFTFRHFESHYEVHHHSSFFPKSEEFLLSPSIIMSVNPQSSIIGQLLASSEDSCSQSKRSKQNDAVQVNA